MFQSYLLLSVCYAKLTYYMLSSGLNKVDFFFNSGRPIVVALFIKPNIINALLIFSCICSLKFNVSSNGQQKTYKDEDKV